MLNLPFEQGGKAFHQVSSMLFSLALHEAFVPRADLLSGTSQFLLLKGMHPFFHFHFLVGYFLYVEKQ